MKGCRHCGRFIEKDATYCKHCGKEQHETTDNRISMEQSTRSIKGQTTSMA